MKVIEPLPRVILPPRVAVECRHRPASGPELQDNRDVLLRSSFAGPVWAADLLLAAGVPVDLTAKKPPQYVPPAPGAEWAWCDAEGGACRAAAGTLVRYGSPDAGRWATPKAVGSEGQVACDNATFGDPAQGYPKQCQWKLP